jgi:hypothetical protein
MLARGRTPPPKKWYAGIVTAGLMLVLMAALLAFGRGGDAQSQIGLVLLEVLLAYIGVRSLLRHGWRRRS